MKIKIIYFAAVGMMIAAGQTLGQAPVITGQPTNVTTVYGNTATFNVSVSGPGPFTYQWLLNGTNVPNVITTMAGNGTTSLTGDNAPAIWAKLAQPVAVAVDASGNIYLADEGTHKVRKVDSTGIITTLAGKGFSSFSGDGGAATNAGLYSPSGLALDHSGNLFIADMNNNRIRKIGTNGVIATVAGKGTYGFAGDGGAATNATLSAPAGIAIDSTDNLYIADTSNQRIRKVGTNGLINTIAGNGTQGFLGDGGAATNARLSSPSAVALDPFGQLYIADTYNHRIRRVNAQGIISTVAGNGYVFGFTNGINYGGYSGDGGVATNASLNFPFGITVDASGNLLIGDYGNNRVRQVNSSGIITTFVGGGSLFVGDGHAATNATLNLPYGVTTDIQGHLYIADSGDHRIRKVDTNGISTIVGNGDGGPATNVQISSVSAIAVGMDESIYFSENLSNRVRKVDANGIITTVAGKDPSGGFTGNGGPAVNSRLKSPYGLTMDSSGNLYIGDDQNYRIRIIDTNGIINTFAGNANNGFSGDNGPATNASLSDIATGLAVDNTGGLLISDAGNHRIRRVDTHGIITTIAGNGTNGIPDEGGNATNTALGFPIALAVASSDNLFFDEPPEQRIRRIGVDGTITTFAGNGTSGFSGDNGPATNAMINGPAGITSDMYGNLFFADSSNYRIRKIDTNGIIATVAGNGITGFAGDNGPAINASLMLPSVLAGDTYGNLYFHDRYRIRKIIVPCQPVLPVPGVSPNNVGGYSVIVSNASGSVTSLVATLVGYAPTVIAAQPVGQTNVIGSTLSFGVTATGTGPFDYQWRFNGTNLSDAPDLPTLILTNVGVGDSGSYSVVVSSPYDSVVSASGSLFVYVLPSIISQPANASVPVYSTVYFSVTAAGTGPFSYQWLFNGANFRGTSSVPILPLGNVSASNIGSYSVIATSPYGSATSTVATLDVYVPPPPVITTQPTNQTLQSGGTVTMNVTVSGTGPFNYQWLVNGVPVPDIISTVAGGGGWGFSGDGGAATNAALQNPVAVTVDAFDNLYIADPANARVRKVDTNGIISTFVGNGISAYSGDGGAATNASLSFPEGLAADASGNVYVSDVNRIRKIDASGMITTVAGNGTNGFSGDGGPATNASFNGTGGLTVDAAGNLYLPDYYNRRIRKVDTHGIITTVAGNGSLGFSGDGGLAVNASLANPTSVAIGPVGELYILDSLNGRVRRADPNGIIVTVAGNGQGCFGCPPGNGGAATNAGLADPIGIAVDAVGNFFISDFAQNRVQKVDVRGIITIIAGSTLSNGYSGDGGLAINAMLNWPDGLATDSKRDLYIADAYNTRIRKVNLHNQPTLTLDGVTPDQSGSYQVVVTSPYGSATSGLGVLLVYDPPFIVTQPTGQTNGVNGSMAFAVETGGAGPYTFQWMHNGTNLPNTITTAAGNGNLGYSGDGGAATNASLNNPRGVIAYYSGGFFISDTGNQRVRYVDDDGIITTSAGNGLAGYTGDGGAGINASLNYPIGGSPFPWVDFYLADSSNHVVRSVGLDGTISTVAGNGVAGYSGDGGPATNASLNFPSDVNSAYEETLLIADQRNHRIRRVDDFGIITTVAGNGVAGYSGDGGAATNASLNYPSTVLFNGGNIYIADRDNHRIRKINGIGIITTVAGNGIGGNSGDGGLAINASLNHPTGIIFDTIGNLYITDSDNHRIRQVDGSGIITTIAGDGVAGFGGDGRDALTASLAHPSSMALDYWNYFYIADTDNNRVRKITLANQPFLILNNLTFNDAGSYSVIVSTPAGSLTSSNASLVISDPFISVSPGDQLVPADADATFSVSALGGSTLHYQWQWNGTNISGANASNFTVSSAQCTNDGIYQVVVSDSASSVTSDGAMLTAVSASATLSIETTGLSSGIRIGWSPVSPCDRLQAATNAAGPWIDATTQNNPQTNTATGKAVFYRVISH